MCMAIDAFIYQPMIRRGALRKVIMIASMGVFIITENTIAAIFGTMAKFVPLDAGRVFIKIGAANVTLLQIYIVSITVILLAGTVYWLVTTKTGRTIRAIASDAELAEIMGIEPVRTRLIIYGLGSGLAAVAAIFKIVDLGINPAMSIHMLLLATIAVIVGGIEKMYAGIVGGFLLGLILNLGIWKIDSCWQGLIAYSLLILIVLIMPSGLLGRKGQS